MTITVGTDTYITIVEADAYLALTRVSTDPALVAWDALSDANKEIYLRKATQAINRLKFPGKKNGDSTQALSFPRDIRGVSPLRRNPEAYTGTFYDKDIFSLLPTYIYDPSSINVWVVNDDVPEDIKSAEAEEALELAYQSEDTELWKAARGALKSFRMGDLSETYRDAPRRSANSAETVLRSTTAQEYVSEWLGGSYRVL